MGLFYTALERAEESKTGDVRPAVAAGPTPVTNWDEAAERDLAGFPLVARGPAAEPPSVAAPSAVRRTTQLDVAALGLTASEAGVGKEQYRILRMRVLEGLRSQRRRGLLITSALAGEGKTLVAANLALQCSALKEERVLLIDADLRRARLSECMQPAPDTGLREYLIDGANLDAVLWDVDPWLSILPTQRLHEQSAELLASQRMAALLQEALERFDLILLDGAPVAPVADSRILARLVGASLLVVRADVTPTEAIQQAAELLHPTLLGSVLNGANKRFHKKYGYPYADPETAQAVPKAATVAEAKP